jgi:hypothetical protein
MHEGSVDEHQAGKSQRNSRVLGRDFRQQRCLPRSRGNS